MRKYVNVFCTLMLVFTLLIAVTGCNLNLEEEETTTLPDKTALTNDTENLVAYYNDLLGSVFAVRPIVKTWRSIDAKDIEFVKRGQEETDSSLSTLNAVSSQAKNYILTNIRDIEVEPGEVEYGGDTLSVLYDIYIREPADVADAKLNEKEEDSKTVIEDDKFIITLEDVPYPAPGGSLVAKLFKFLDKDEILQEFEKTGDYLKMGASEDIVLEYKDCTVFVEVDRKTDQILYITLTKNVAVLAPVEGVGSFEAYGEMDVRLTFTDTTKFEFNWTDPYATEAEQ